VQGFVLSAEAKRQRQQNLLQRQLYQHRKH